MLLVVDRHKRRGLFVPKRQYQQQYCLKGLTKEHHNSIFWEGRMIQ